MPQAHLKIEGTGATGTNYRVFLDGEEVSHFTRAIHLDMSVDGVNSATLEVYLERVDLSAEVEGKLVHIDPTHLQDEREHDRTSFASRLWEWVRQ